MTTIQVEIKDDLATALGLEAIQKHFQKEMEFLEIELLAKKMNDSIKKSGIDWEMELENARKEAFEEYQNKQ